MCSMCIGRSLFLLALNFPFVWSFHIVWNFLCPPEENYDWKNTSRKAMWRLKNTREKVEEKICQKAKSRYTFSFRYVSFFSLRLLFICLFYCLRAFHLRFDLLVSTYLFFCRLAYENPKTDEENRRNSFDEFTVTATDGLSLCCIFVLLLSLPLRSLTRERVPVITRKQFKFCGHLVCVWHLIKMHLNLWISNLSSSSIWNQIQNGQIKNNYCRMNDRKWSRLEVRQNDPKIWTIHLNILIKIFVMLLSLRMFSLWTWIWICFCWGCNRYNGHCMCRFVV